MGKASPHGLLTEFCFHGVLRPVVLLFSLCPNVLELFSSEVHPGAAELLGRADTPQQGNSGSVHRHAASSSPQLPRAPRCPHKASLTHRRPHRAASCKRETQRQTGARRGDRETEMGGRETFRDKDRQREQRQRDGETSRKKRRKTETQMGKERLTEIDRAGRQHR